MKIRFVVEGGMAWWEESTQLNSKYHATHFLVLDLESDCLMTQRVSITESAPSNWEMT